MDKTKSKDKKIKANQPKKYLTFMLLPDDSSRARRFRLSELRFKVARNFFIVFMLACTIALIDYGSMRVKYSEMGKVMRENTSQKIELQELNSRIGGLQTKLSKLQMFDKKLRIIANIETPAKADEDHTGMGGADADAGYFLGVADKRKELVGRMHSDLTQLETEAGFQERSFTELQEYLIKQSSLFASTPSIRPTKGWGTSSYGKRKDPFTGRTQSHKGLDIANRIGTEIVAPGDGIVTRVARLSSLGKLVEVSHGYGIKTRYAHLSKSFVKVGDKIKRGDKLAAMGNTGRSTGPHLHYEVVVNGVNVNPSKYILN